MNPSGNATHKAKAVEPSTFRAAATGIGQALDASIRTGAQRAQYSIDQAPPQQRAAIPSAEGFPTPTPTYDPTTRNTVFTPTTLTGRP